MKNRKKFPISQSKKSFKKAVLDHLGEMQKLVVSIKRDMNKEIKKEVNERLGNYVHQMESALDGVIALRAMFIKKGFISQEEYNKEKAKMRKRKK